MKHHIHFCNNECMIKHKRYLFPKINLKCSECDAPLERTKQQVKRSMNGNHFCNNLCKNRFLIKRRWKNPSAKANSYKHKRDAIIKRFNQTCIHCGYNEDCRMLDIHHMDGNHSNHDDSNLFSICTWCHTKHHRIGMKISVNFGV